MFLVLSRSIWWLFRDGSLRRTQKAPKHTYSHWLSGPLDLRSRSSLTTGVVMVTPDIEPSSHHFTLHGPTWVCPGASVIHGRSHHTLTAMLRVTDDISEYYTQSSPLNLHIMQLAIYFSRHVCCFVTWYFKSSQSFKYWDEIIFFWL